MHNTMTVKTIGTNRFWARQWCTRAQCLDPYGDDLDKAQLQKLDMVCKKIHLRAGDRHLDLGCGYGGLICHAAKQYGTDSTGVTLSKKQVNWANRQAKQMGVEKTARALWLDYRDAPREKYDKITCLEMAEHVGSKNFGKFLTQVSSMLKDDGLFGLQIVGVRRPWQFEDFTWGLFLARHILPGSDASCQLGWVIDHLENAGFEIHSVETIGVHYSATHKRWCDNWVQNRQHIETRYGVRWYRIWEWFLAWSAIVAEQGSAAVYQIVAHKNLMSFDRKRFVTERKLWEMSKNSKAT